MNSSVIIPWPYKYLKIPFFLHATIQVTFVHDLDAAIIWKFWNWVVDYEIEDISR
jgi:hypothetical protein